MAATIWSGAITFGLVNIPVTLHSAVRDTGLSFRMLHEKDKSPVGYERLCKKEKKAVPWDEIVKGYEYEKDRYVILDEDDFEKAAAAMKSSKVFDILDFVEKEEIDPRFFEKPYFLVPRAGSEKIYALLREAIRETGRVGIGHITMRKKQYLGAIHVIGDALVMEMMRFADEVLAQDEYRFPPAKDLRPQELKMAQQLVESLAAPFEPEKYKDEYKDSLMRIIKAKMKGKKLAFEETAEPEATGVVDLMERLKQSLDAAKKPAPARKKAARKTKAA